MIEIQEMRKLEKKISPILEEIDKQKPNRKPDQRYIIHLYLKAISIDSKVSSDYDTNEKKSTGIQISKSAPTDR